MKKIAARFSLLIFATALVISLGCSSGPIGGDRGEFREVNNWIRDNMELYYFWNDVVPEKADGMLPPEIFYESIQDPQDEFSYITDDADSYLNELNGEVYTAGYSPQFIQLQENGPVYIVIRFVYPGGFADQQGLERGDIIYQINGNGLTEENYLSLYRAQGTSDLALGTYDSETHTISPNGVTVTVDKNILDLNPVVYTNVYDYGQDQIGYLFYARFLTGRNDAFVDSLDNALADLKASGITDLVIDLRYNPGGRISVAEELADRLVPSNYAFQEDIFMQYEYNDLITQYYLEYEGPNSPNLISRFSADARNVGLERVYFLTTSNTASSSELLINGLSPYMDAYIVGAPTLGKFYGSIVARGDFGSSYENYAIAPIILKYSNALGVTDFADGLTPDFEVYESLLNPVPLGDVTDPLLSTAIEHITTGSVSAKTKGTPPAYNSLENEREIQMGNILKQITLKKE